jgi:4-amino-4-deoxy-L-arabinose transferase-like glycosyltransferase
MCFGGAAHAWREAITSTAESQPTALQGLFDQFARGWRGVLLIGLIALVSSLFGAVDTPVMDVGEAGYAQASRQMAESGDAVRIRLQDADRHVAPAGIYWLQATSAQITRPFARRVNAIWPYRLPSALGIALAAIAALWGGTALIGERAAFFGAALFAASMMAGFAGMLAIPDGVATGFITLALAALARLYADQTHQKRHALIFWGALACALLVGGVIAPLVAALSLAKLALWEKRWNWMRPLIWWPGPALALAIAAPWFIATAATEASYVLSDLAGILAPAFGARSAAGFPGYHVFLLPFLIFPATYALPAAARLVWEAMRAPRADAEHAAMRFLIAWAAPTFLLFELAPTKLPHLVLPVYPAIALMCGAGLAAMYGRRWRSAHPAGLVLFAVAGLMIVALTAAGATFMPGDLGTDLRRAVSAALVGVGVVGVALAALLMLRQSAARACVLTACALLLSFSLRDRLLPEVRELHVSNDTLAALTRARLTPRDNRPLWVVGYDEASLVFLTRTSIRLADAQLAGATAQSGDAVVVEARALQELRTALRQRGLDFAAREAPVNGLVMARGARVQLFVGAVEASDAPADAPPQNP